MRDKKLEIALKNARSEVDGGTGKMIRPVVGSVTTPYSRTSEHPVFGQVRPHNGTDFKGDFNQKRKFFAFLCTMVVRCVGARWSFLVLRTC